MPACPEPMNRAGRLQLLGRGERDLGDGDSLSVLMRRADAALYEAKRRGRNRAVPALR